MRTKYTLTSAEKVGNATQVYVIEEDGEPVRQVTCTPAVAKWLEEKLNRKKVDSEALREAARINGINGGRPRKDGRPPSTLYRKLEREIKRLRSLKAAQAKGTIGASQAEFDIAECREAIRNLRAEAKKEGVEQWIS